VIPPPFTGAAVGPGGGATTTLGAGTAALGTGATGSGAGAAAGATDELAAAVPSGDPCAAGAEPTADPDRAERMRMKPPAPRRPTSKTPPSSNGTRERCGDGTVDSEPDSPLRDASTRPGIEMAAADTLEDGMMPDGSSAGAEPVGSLWASQVRTLSRC